MSNNCLVTKLKSVVSNDSLPLLGYVTFKVSQKENSVERERQVGLYGTFKVIASPDKIIYRGTEYEVLELEDKTSSNPVIAEDKAYTFKVSKYGLTKLAIPSDVTTLLKLKENELSGCISLTSLVIGSNVINVDLLKTLPALDTLELNSNCTGTLHFSEYPLLNRVLNANNINIEIRDAIADILSSGTTAHSISISKPYKVTIYGHNYNVLTGIALQEGYTNDHFWAYLGEARNQVVALNPTAEEISTWQGQGITVVYDAETGEIIG